MNKRFLIITILAAGLTNTSWADKQEKLASPNGKIVANINIGKELTYSASFNGEQILKDCPLSLQVGQEFLGVNPKLSNTKRTKIDEQIRPVVPLKQAVVPNKANALTLNFKGYSVEFRAYDNGVAYRFIINKKGVVDIVNEGINYHLPTAFEAHISKTRNFNTSYEQPYTHISTAQYKADDEITYLPVLLESPKGTKVLISESDVRDYPHTFLKSTGANGFTAVHPKSPETWEPRGDRGWTITKERNCIARTNGQRTLPWRFAVIGSDATIAANQMELVLGGKCELQDVSWIKPGQVNWDWWNHWTVWDVDFESGINNDTYKYIIDTASKFGVEYVLLDEGWNKRVEDPFTYSDGIDVKELVEYAAKKHVGIILWLSWLTVEQHTDLIKHYADMGVKGLKIDFMDHSDQWMVNFYERTARECAKHKLLVDFHGSFKPSGLEQRLPNLISYEGVRGLEQGGGCRPENSIWLPYMRNAVGAMDFTPGSMQNAQPEDNHGTGSLPMGGGTRAYQMALYVCFESGLQMLADSPTRYLREEACTRFIASVPTTWDETRVLAAKAGDYYVVAKRKGAKWFVGAITGSKPQDITISLDFLSRPAMLTSFRDGRNAHRIAVDYKKETQEVNPATTLTLHLARNGGWCGSFDYKQQQEEWADIKKYAKDNQLLAQQPNNGKRVVFLGNSITEFWRSNRPDFFIKNDYIGHGISGQTSYQFKARFREDVLNLHPKVLIINAGTNDIAENTCPYNEDQTFANIVEMVEMARAQNIKVIMTTILPCARFGWRPDIKDGADKIEHLNARLADYAAAHHIIFVDYYTPMVYGTERQLNPQYTKDGCHPTNEGYAVMEPLIQKAIKQYR